MLPMKQAMILAAGFGTRLRPLTYVRPKTLVPILNRPLLGIIMEQLTRAGVQRLAVNSHYLADQVEKFVESQASTDLLTRIFIESTILGTGGGIKNTTGFWGDDPFLVINGDVLTDIDLKDVYAYHMNHNHPVTMVVHDYERFNQVRVNSRLEVTGFSSGASSRGAGESILAFTGIQVLDPDVLEEFPAGASHSIDTYERMIGEGRVIAAYVTHSGLWTDIGHIQDYLNLHENILTGKVHAMGLNLPVAGGIAAGKDKVLEAGARLEGWASLGDRVVIKEDGLVSNSILWNDVTVEKGASVINSVVADGATVCGRIENSIVIKEKEKEGGKGVARLMGIA